MKKESQESEAGWGYDDTARAILTAAASAGFLGVALGAFGAHGLQALLIERNTLAVWQTGVQYWFFHALALFALGVGFRLSTGLRRKVAISWIAGMVIFSGSLSFLATTGPRWLGAVTPVGGVLLLIGWFFLLMGAWRERGHRGARYTGENK